MKTITSKKLSKAISNIRANINIDAVWIQMAAEQGKDYLMTRAMEELSTSPPNREKATIFLLLAAVVVEG
jgi:hypothetical protein